MVLTTLRPSKTSMIVPAVIVILGSGIMAAAAVKAASGLFFGLAVGFPVVIGLWVWYQAKYRIAWTEEWIEVGAFRKVRISWTDIKSVDVTGTGIGSHALWVDAMELGTKKQRLNLAVKGLTPADQKRLGDAIKRYASNARKT